MSKSAKEALSGQSDLFAGLGDDAAPDIEITPAKIQASQKEQLQWERELLGLYISAHPIDKYEQYLRENTVNFHEIAEHHDAKTMTIGGILTGVRDITTKKGDKMAFLTIEDKFGPFSIIVFPRLYEEVKDLLIVDKVITIEGRITAKDRDGNTAPPQMIANQITEITDQMLAEFQPNFRKKKTPRGNYEEFLETNGAKKIGSKKPTASGAPIRFVDPVEEIKRAQAEKAQCEANLAATSSAVNEPLADYQSAADRVAGQADGSQEVSQSSPDQQQVASVAEMPATATSAESSPKMTKLYVRLIDASNRQKLTSLRQICQNYPGNQPIILVLGENDQKTAIKLPFQVNLSEQLMTKLKQEFAEQDLVLR